MICGRSRYLAHIIANKNAIQVRLMSSIRRPGMARNAAKVKDLPKKRSAPGKIKILWQKIKKFRHIIRNTCKKSGMGNCLMIPSAAIKLMHPSAITDEMKPQKINPAARKGRN